jgi:hypothetical protein
MSAVLLHPGLGKSPRRAPAFSIDRKGNLYAFNGVDPTNPKPRLIACYGERNREWAWLDPQRTHRNRAVVCEKPSFTTDEDGEGLTFRLIDRESATVCELESERHVVLGDFGLRSRIHLQVDLGSVASLDFARDAERAWVISDQFRAAASVASASTLAVIAVIAAPGWYADAVEELASFTIGPPSRPSGLAAV